MMNSLLTSGSLVIIPNSRHLVIEVIALLQCSYGSIVSRFYYTLIQEHEIQYNISSYNAHVDPL